MVRDLITAAREGEARLFLSFGGQGAGWFDALQKYYANPALRPLLQTCLEAMREELPYVDRAQALPHGFEVDAWLQDPSTLPSPDYIGLVGVSVPLIFLCQLAAVRELAEHGLELVELLRYTRGASGQSQGLFAACVHAMGGDSLQQIEVARRFAKFVFYLGARSQRTYPFPYASDDEIDRSAAVSTWRNSLPSPMVAVVGCDRLELEKRLRQFNTRLPADRQISVSLTFSSSRVVLSGHRRSLIDFNAEQRTYLLENDIKYVYVRTTCPFHSPLMEPIRSMVEADFARIGFGLFGADLRVPVYSSFDGRNLQDDEEATTGLYLDALIHPLDLRNALRRVRDDRLITHVIDFGPGSESRHLTTHVLAELGCTKPVVSAARLPARPKVASTNSEYVRV
jgi:malonyl CoA-acyl carrier protein transacylase